MTQTAYTQVHRHLKSLKLFECQQLLVYIISSQIHFTSEQFLKLKRKENTGMFSYTKGKTHLAGSRVVVKQEISKPSHTELTRENQTPLNHIKLDLTKQFMNIDQTRLSQTKLNQT